MDPFSWKWLEASWKINWALLNHKIYKKYFFNASTILIKKLFKLVRHHLNKFEWVFSLINADNFYIEFRFQFAINQNLLVLCHAKIFNKKSYALLFKQVHGKSSFWKFLKLFISFISFLHLNHPFKIIIESTGLNIFCWAEKSSLFNRFSGSGSRLSPLTTPPCERSPQMTLSLQEILIVGCAVEQAKFSELTMDMFRWVNSSLVLSTL